MDELARRRMYPAVALQLIAEVTVKRLGICCDGTWNRADQDENGAPCPTNVVKLASRVATRGGEVAQIIYYDQGLEPVTVSAFGDGLEENIHEAYRFLVGNSEVARQFRRAVSAA